MPAASRSKHENLRSTLANTKIHGKTGGTGDARGGQARDQEGVDAAGERQQGGGQDRQGRGHERHPWRAVRAGAAEMRLGSTEAAAANFSCCGSRLSANVIDMRGRARPS